MTERRKPRPIAIILRERPEVGQQARHGDHSGKLVFAERRALRRVVGIDQRPPPAGIEAVHRGERRKNEHGRGTHGVLEVDERKLPRIRNIGCNEIVVAEHLVVEAPFVIGRKTEQFAGQAIVPAAESRAVTCLAEIGAGAADS